MQSNAYDEFAPRMLARGLRPVPIGPGTKSPQALHNGVYVDLPEWQTRPPITAPQPGAGIGLALGERDLVALDLDDDDIAVALLDILPDTPVRKVGRRGETLFYRAPGLASRKFLINKVPVCEILAVGTQTVLPPTVHPDTGIAVPLDRDKDATRHRRHRLAVAAGRHRGANRGRTDPLRLRTGAGTQTQRRSVRQSVSCAQ